MTKQKMQVVMLATDKQSSIVQHIHKNINTLHYRYNNNLYQHEDYINQHLYITSNDEIKEGDWIYDRAHDRIIQFDNLVVNGGSCSDHCVKIIATTNSSLKIWSHTCFSGEEIYNKLPQIPDSFIKEYVESNGTIKEVEVEMEETTPMQKTINDMTKQILFTSQVKTNPDNTIIIHSKPKLYTREDVESKLKELRRECGEAHDKGLSPDNVGISQFL